MFRFKLTRPLSFYSTLLLLSNFHPRCHGNPLADKPSSVAALASQGVWKGERVKRAEFGSWDTECQPLSPYKGLGNHGNCAGRRDWVGGSQPNPRDEKENMEGTIKCNHHADIHSSYTKLALRALNLGFLILCFMTVGLYPFKTALQQPESYVSGTGVGVKNQTQYVSAYSSHFQGVEPSPSPDFSGS